MSSANIETLPCGSPLVQEALFLQVVHFIFLSVSRISPHYQLSACTQPKFFEHRQKSPRVARILLGDKPQGRDLVARETDLDKGQIDRQEVDQLAACCKQASAWPTNWALARPEGASYTARYITWYYAEG